ncbi:MAG TPA: IPT/TIG domain-containing protein, partial [Solirubrobacterales bacterium]|nr:IPT/TIG domain-containing protein [Solirubrobacterales bacterium]
MALAASAAFAPSLAQSDPPSNAFRFVYDEDGRLKAAIDPEGDTATYKWDPAGNLLSIDRVYSSSLSILQLSPAEGSVGDTIEIAGTGFSPTPSANTVKFNGTVATVEKASPWSLSVEVPSGASSGPVTVSTGEVGPVNSAQSFTVVASSSPTITSISPSMATAGQEVTISGAGFDSAPSANVVRFNGVTALVKSASSSEVKFEVPTDRLGGRVSIGTPKGSAEGPDLFVPPNNAATSTVGSTGRMAIEEAETISISTAGTRALRLIDGKAGERISIVPSGATFTGSVKIYRPNGAEVSGSSGSLSGIHGPFALPEDGTYTVLVEGSGEATGSVDLTAYTFADVSGTLTPTAGGTSQSVSIAKPGQIANYAVTVDAGDVVTVKAANASFTGEYC